MTFRLPRDFDFDFLRFAFPHVHDGPFFAKLPTAAAPVNPPDPRDEKLKRLEAVRELIAKHADDLWLSENGRSIKTREMHKSHLYFALAKAYRGEYPSGEFKGRVDKLEVEALRRLSEPYFGAFSHVGAQFVALDEHTKLQAELKRKTEVCASCEVVNRSQAQTIGNQHRQIVDLNAKVKSLESQNASLRVQLRGAALHEAIERSLSADIGRHPGVDFVIIEDPVRNRQADFCAATLGRDAATDERIIASLEQGNRKLADSVRTLTSEKAKLEGRVADLERRLKNQQVTIQAAQKRAHDNAVELGLSCEKPNVEPV